MDKTFEFPIGMTLHVSEPPIFGEMAGYMSGNLHVFGRAGMPATDMDVLYRIKEDETGPGMCLVNVDSGERSIGMHWNAIEDAMTAAASQWLDETTREINDRAAAVLSRYFDRDEETGKFYQTFESKVKLDDQDIRGILYTEDKAAALDGLLSGKYNNYENSRYQYATDRLDEMLKADQELSQKAYLIGWTSENYAYANYENRYPLEDIMDQEVELNIVVDTGDRNYEFTCNNAFHGYYGDPSDPELDETSSLLWLCQQQGLSQSDLLRAFHKEFLLPAELQKILHDCESLKNTLVQEHGFNDRRERLSRGNYAKLLKIKDEIGKTQRQLAHARNTLENNSLTYEEAQHRFPTSLHHRYPSKESFESAQAEVLPKNKARIAELESTLKELENSILRDDTMSKVNLLSAQYKELSDQCNLIRQTDEYRKAQFADSVIREGVNITSGSNALTFFVKMPLRDAMQLNDIIQTEEPQNNSYYPEKRTGKSSIILDRDTCCGLYDFDEGAGGLLEIQLYKDVELPVKYIYSAQVDSTLGASARSIWGEVEYTETLKETREVPQTHDLTLLIDQANAQLKSGSTTPAKEHDLTI